MTVLIQRPPRIDLCEITTDPTGKLRAKITRPWLMYLEAIFERIGGNAAATPDDIEQGQLSRVRDQLVSLDTSVSMICAELEKVVSLETSVAMICAEWQNLVTLETSLSMIAADSQAVRAELDALAVAPAPAPLQNVAFLNVANVFTKVQTVTPYRANITGAVSIDLAATAMSNNLHLTLTGNVASFALTNPSDGAVYNFRFIQDGTGSRTFAAFPAAFKFPGGTPPVFSTAINAVDFMSCEYGSTEATYMCSFLKGMA